MPNAIALVTGNFAGGWHLKFISTSPAIRLLIESLGPRVSMTSYHCVMHRSAVWAVNLGI